MSRKPSSLDVLTRVATAGRGVVARRFLLGVPFAIAACSSSPPPRTSFDPLTYEYLTPLRLNVATIDIDDTWRAPSNPREVGAYAPASPLAALRQMATDRLLTGGGSGKAVFTILDARLLNRGNRVEANLAVRLAASSADGSRSAYAEARVARSLTLIDDDPDTLRDALYTLVKQAMEDMNVEFEFQVRRTMRDWLQTTSTTAPVGPPVESQDLPAPGAPPTPGSQTPTTPMPMAPEPLAPPMAPQMQMPLPQSPTAAPPTIIPRMAPQLMPLGPTQDDQ